MYLFPTIFDLFIIIYDWQILILTNYIWFKFVHIICTEKDKDTYHSLGQGGGDWYNFRLFPDFLVFVVVEYIILVWCVLLQNISRKQRVRF